MKNFQLDRRPLLLGSLGFLAVFPAFADPSSVQRPTIIPRSAVGPVVKRSINTEESRSSKGSFSLRDVPLNDVFELLSEEAGLQYFHNPLIGTEEYLVTGQIRKGSPIANMETLAILYGLELGVKGNTEACDKLVAFVIGEKSEVAFCDEERFPHIIMMVGRGGLSWRENGLGELRDVGNLSVGEKNLLSQSLIV